MVTQVVHPKLSTLVATYTREIVEELSLSRKTQTLHDMSPAPAVDKVRDRDLPAIKRPLERPTIKIDMKVAEQVGTCSRIFPGPDGNVVDKWLVFARHSPSTREEAESFFCTGVIPALTGSEVFVREAYLTLLLREVDPTGLELYSPLLGNRQLAQRDVIRILLDSEEGRGLNVCSIVIPHPSSWLDGFDSVEQMPFLTDMTGA